METGINMNRSVTGTRHTQRTLGTDGALKQFRTDDHVEFLFDQTQKLRNSVASVRSLSEILYDNLDIDEDLRQRFLTIIIKETEKLAKMIDRVSDAPDPLQMARPV